jgi:hypothetical protein
MTSEANDKAIELEITALVRFLRNFAEKILATEFGLADKDC